MEVRILSAAFLDFSLFRWYDLTVAKKKSKNMLYGSYSLGDIANKNRIAPLWVHLGVVGGGLALGYVAYPYQQSPLGSTLLGAAGSVAAVGLLLLVYDALRDKNIVQITK